MEIFTYINAALLGLVEGLTEFLPISSTGHLILVGDLLQFSGANHVFEIVVQLGAILAIVWLYRAKFWHVLCDLFKDKDAQHFVRNILLAFFPSVIIGLLAHDFIKEALFNPTVVAVALIIGGFAILIIEKVRPEPTIHSTEEMSAKTALLIGLFQCVAMIPGVSRAGATIMGALLCRVSRLAAAEFSFFLAVPTMIAASSYDLYKNAGALTSQDWNYMAVGFVVAFLSALIVVKWLVGFVSKHGFGVFAWYRIVLGAVILSSLYLV